MLVLPLTDFSAGALVNFQRASDSLPIMRMNSQCRSWIDPLETVVKRVYAMFVYFRFKGFSDLRISPGPNKQPLGEGFDVEPGTAANNYVLAASGYVAYALGSQISKHRRIELLVGINDIDEMMRDLLSLFPRRFRRANIHMTVDLLRIGANNLRLNLCREIDDDIGFADGGGTKNNDELGFHHVRTKSGSER